jgi:hypothetical protein
LCPIYWLLALTLLFVVAWPPILVALSETDIICARIYVVLVSEYLLLGFLFLSWLVALYGLLGFFVLLVLGNWYQSDIMAELILHAGCVIFVIVLAFLIY